MASRGTRSAGPGRTLLAVAIYAGGACVLAATLAYPLWVVLGALLDRPPPFHRLTLRLLKGLALVGLWPLLAALGRSDRRGWGLAPGPGVGRELALGLLAGVASLALLAALLVGLGVRTPQAGALEAPGRLLAGALLTGAAVAVIEELWFRGALHSVLEAAWGARTAVIAGAALWAVVHFVRADRALAAEAIGWLGGWTVLAGALERLGGDGVGGALAGLLAAGILLGQARSASGRIAACIGLHAGWVAAIRILRGASELDPTAAGVFLAAGYDGVVGWLAALLFATAALLWARRGLA